MTTLYRGDMAHVDEFLLESTDRDALFGRGFYLTDDRRVAEDYTLKGVKAVMRSEDATSARHAVGYYLKAVMDEELGWPDRREEIRREWQIKAREAQWGPSASKAALDVVEADYHRAVAKEAGKLLRRAKAVYAERKGGLSVVEETTGRFVMVALDAEPHVSEFQFDDDFLARTLHADRPLPADALEVVRSVVKETFGERVADFRDRDGNFMTFDAWVDLFPRARTRYAWMNDEEGTIGGEGEAPSLDQVWNGTHAGFHVFLEAGQAALMEGLTDIGYGGLSYDGGIRLAGTGARGGGGHRHSAYVLWDGRTVNAARTTSTPVPRNPIEETFERTMRFGSPGLRVW